MFYASKKAVSADCLQSVDASARLGLIARSQHRLILKRLFDISAAAMMIVAFAPLFLAISILLLAKGHRSVFYRHERTGRDGRPFQCLKFRTMEENADQILQRLLDARPDLRQEWEETQKLSHDPRVIPGIGTFLRTTSLDELPQLFNVLMGDMSIVGPRPITKEELVRYSPYQSHYLSVKPGITGPWQIGGRSSMSYEDRVKTDVWYVENGRLRTDLTIFVLTVVSFVTGQLKGAH